MAGNGISLQTTIAQSGNVAKTQLKGQQQNQQTAPLSEQVDKSKDLKVDRVKQAEKTEKGQVDPDARREKKQRKKKRRRPKLYRARASANDRRDQEPDERTGEPADSAEEAGNVGSLVDKRV